MSFSNDLLQHSIRLLGNPPGPAPGTPRSVDMRRSVSAAYYALFHHLNAAAVEQIAPHASPRVASRIHRWLEHGEMKKRCREFASQQLGSTLSDLLEGAISDDLKTVATSFIKLQEARHHADYDLEYQISWQQARDFIQLSAEAIGAWERIRNTAEANIFILSLLMWKNWEKER